MVRRLLFIPVVCGLLVLSVAANATAQTKPAAKPAAPAAAKPVAAKPVAKPAEAPASEPDPALDKALDEWYQSSKSITKLEGQHIRFVYDYNFAVLKKAEGEFYYESPDKGRIDLAAYKFKTGEEKTLTKTSPINGNPVQFTVEADMAERWICDGAKILEIDEPAKSVTSYEIPKEARGTNIMDGPLPFLFGMPPEKANQRYRMRLVEATKDRYVIQVLPRWQQDAANYKWAVVVLERKTMLPEAVQLIDPAQTIETVYTFPRIEKNPKTSFIGRMFRANEDPFKPNLKGYKFIEPNREDPKKVATKEPQPGPAPVQAQTVVPSVVGLDHADAKKVLEARGYKVEFFKGTPANAPQQAFRAYDQLPVAKTPLPQGSLVKVQLYVEAPIAVTKGAQEASVKEVGSKEPVAKTISLPNVQNLDWKIAERELRDAGFDVKFVRGKVASKPDNVFKVQEQSPRGGAKLREGDVVTLTLYIAEEKPKK